MENIIEIKNEYNTLDKLQSLLTKETIYDCFIDYDIWDFRLDDKGQMEQCLVVKKSNMHAVKLYFTNANTIKVSYIIPSKIMHAYFGKSVKARRNIIEIITGAIKQAILVGPQQKAFDELVKDINKIAA